MSDALLRVNDLSVCTQTESGEYDIVSHLGFSLQRGEILGIVGESGCGKSVTALSIAGLLPENIKICTGSVTFEGHELQLLKKESCERFRAKNYPWFFKSQ